MECEYYQRSDGSIKITDRGIGTRAIVLSEDDQRKLIKFLKNQKSALFIDAICEA